MKLPFIIALAAAAILWSAGCDWAPPGKPIAAIDKWKPPAANLDFTSLYTQNCLACHGDGKTISASIPMNHPVYLNILPREILIDVIANGIHGTSMPAFSAKTGGPLTDEQIQVVADGIYQWKTETLPGPLPPYSAPPGNVASGQQAFGVHCASCHGAEGNGMDASGAATTAGSVVEPSYLGLVSDQYLRTITIAGRPDLGMPDWQSFVSGQAMTAQEIADVTAWMASHRKTPTPQPSDIGLQ